MNLKFQLPLLAVEDISVSKQFYQQLFDQEVSLDLGRNVTFSGGFALQQDFAWLVEVPPASVLSRSHNMELYFEVDDFDAFLERLEQFEVTYVHPPKQHDWMQRVVRIYDPDLHMIEIGESMEIIACRFLKEGKSPEEVAALIQHPLSFVLACQNKLFDSTTRRPNYDRI